MNGSEIKRPDWFFYPAWVVVSILSVSVSWFASFLVIKMVTNWVGHTIQVNGQARFTEDVLFLYIFFPMLCALSGILQYLLLRMYLPKMRGWVLATLAGCFLVIAVMVVVLRIFGLTFLTRWNGALAFAVIGGVIGLCQWVFLRRRVSKAVWWVLFSILGWGLAVLGRISAEIFGSAMVQLLTAIVPPAIVAGFAWWIILRPETQREKQLI